MTHYTQLKDEEKSRFFIKSQNKNTSIDGRPLIHATGIILTKGFHFLLHLQSSKHKVPNNATEYLHTSTRDGKMP